MFYMLLPSLEDRQAFIGHMHERGIQCVFHYLPLHLSPFGQQYGYGQGACPVTEDVSDRLVRLPLFNDLDEARLERIVEAVCSFVPSVKALQVS
jgi:dTDP-4-amino-4,6-dideoxygalactose transaminase